MPVLKFKVSWEDDDNITRNIAIKYGQTFKELNDAILLAFEFEIKTNAAEFFESNDKLVRLRKISSEVLVNKKDAPALAMVKTPVSALVDHPEKKFIYIYDPMVKSWTFLVELIGIDKVEDDSKSYPYCFAKDGIAPTQLGSRNAAESRLMEVEEKYDLGKEEMEDGFGDEGEESEDEDSEDFGEEEYGMDENEAF